MGLYSLSLVCVSLRLLNRGGNFPIYRIYIASWIASLMIASNLFLDFPFYWGDCIMHMIASLPLLKNVQPTDTKNNLRNVELDLNESYLSTKYPDRDRPTELSPEHNKSNNNFKEIDPNSTSSQFLCLKNGSSISGDEKFKILGFNFTEDMVLSSEKCLKPKKTSCFSTLLNFQTPLIRLSEAGFRFSGQEHTIVCEFCNKSNNLMSVTESPVSSMYHNNGCRIIQHNVPSENELPVPCTSSQFEKVPPRNAENETTQISTGNNLLHMLLTDLQDYSTKPSDDIIFENHLFKSQSSMIDDSCQNDQKHAGYVSIQTLNISQLEREYQDDRIIHLIHICSKLTVKIECKQKKKMVTGSILNNPCKIISTENVQLTDLDDYHKELFLKHSAVGIVYVVTTSHLLDPADRDLIDTEVTLSLDDDRYKEFKLKGLIFSTHKKLGVQQSLLICITSDLNVTKMINDLQQELKNACRSIPDGLKELMTQSVFIISHPDGKKKMLSIGKSSLENYGISSVQANGKRELFLLRDHLNGTSTPAEHILSSLLYTAVTCPGSSGAPVITFTRYNAKWILDIWTHNGINISDGRGVTVLKDYLQSSNSNEVTQLNVSTSGVSSSLSATATVPQSTPRLADPAYPIYSSKQKRLQSLSNWPISHIIHPNVLADAGFFYAGYADCVRCFHCGLGLKSWKAGDDLYVEHSRYRPSCTFLQSVLPAKLILNQPAAQPQPAAPISSSVTSGCGSIVNNNATMFSTHSTLDEVTSLAVTGQLDPYEPNIFSSSSEENSENYPQVGTAITDETATVISDTNHGSQNKTVSAKLLEREKTLLQQLLKCKVCKDAPIKELFLPCGDLYACSACSQKFTRCPLCQKKILGTVTTYFA
ncbi:hypothetical protein Btru_033921 [Bulinus truncatus]|nr:hypothetical protein Btru_033921 [Bulinus truncatus]